MFMYKDAIYIVKNIINRSKILFVKYLLCSFILLYYIIKCIYLV